MTTTDQGGGIARVLDRRPSFDPRSRNYAVRALLPDPQTSIGIRRQIAWAPGIMLDQEQTGHCVAFGWTQEAFMSPVRVSTFGLAHALKADEPTAPNMLAHNIFWRVQQIDRQMGNNWPDGASVLAGAKTMTQLGFLREYRWCFDIVDVIQTLLHLGPVVLGINWRRAMFRPDIYGELSTDGPVDGGHCIVASGYHPAKVVHPSSGRAARPMIRLTNSWGTDWGQGGHAWIEAGKLALLLADDGEACVPVHRSYGEQIPRDVRL